MADQLREDTQDTHSVIFRLSSLASLEVQGIIGALTATGNLSMPPLGHTVTDGESSTSGYGSSGEEGTDEEAFTSGDSDPPRFKIEIKEDSFSVCICKEADAMYSPPAYGLPAPLAAIAPLFRIWQEEEM